MLSSLNILRQSHLTTKLVALLLSAFASSAYPSWRGDETDRLYLVDDLATGQLPDLGYGSDGEKQESNSQPSTVSSAHWWSTVGAEKLRPADSRMDGGKELAAAMLSLIQTELSSNLKDALSAHKITAELSVGTGVDGYQTGSFDLLVPLVDAGHGLLFTQMGIRRSLRSEGEYKCTLNVGLGIRHRVGSWMAGINVFADKETDGDSSRVGFGAEAWTNYLKLSGNAYRRIGALPMIDSPNGEAKEPSGWDVRAEAFMPGFPYLGAKVIHEQFFGSSIGVFGGTYPQTNPSATTFGLSYTPFPLLTLAAEYKQQQDGTSDANVTIGLSFELGTPLGKQLSPRGVRARRLLANAKYDLVNRRNDIVVDYLRGSDGTIELPSHVRGLAGSVLSFPVTLAGSTMTNFSWMGSGKELALVYGGGSNGVVRLPPYQYGGSNTYLLTAIATDSSGAAIKSNVLHVHVVPMKIEITRDTQNHDRSTKLVAALSMPDGSPVADAWIRWTVSDGRRSYEELVRTNQVGKGRITVIGIADSRLSVTAREPQGAMAEYRMIQPIQGAEGSLAAAVESNPTSQADNI